MNGHGIRQWLQEKRSVTRLAYFLQLGTRVLTTLLNLVLTRLIVAAMGKPMNSDFLAFQNLMSLGGLGDLGMGGSVGIRASQLLGQGKEKELQHFLDRARTGFVVLALAAAAGVVLLSPFLPRWLNFQNSEDEGSLPMLFVVGALMVAGVMLTSYLANLNYACGNVTWPIVPGFIFFQAGQLGHLLLARQHQPLWVQCLPYVGVALAGLWLYRLCIRNSHPTLAGFFPLKFDRRTMVALTESSFWVYLCSLGNTIYRSTDGLVINAGTAFPKGTLSDYAYNYKFCDLVLFLVVTASFVSMPKIAQWVASPDAGDQARARQEIRRLNQFQILLGCGAALAYLAGNDVFMKVWWWHSHVDMPPAARNLQLAFALNMALTASGDVGVQLAGRVGKNGLRVIGSLAGAAGLVNLVLSLVAMMMGSLQGIAMATVLAQSLLTLGAGYYICRELQMNWRAWALRSWAFPLAGITFAAWLRHVLPFDSAANIGLLVGAYAAIILLAARALGVNAAFIRDELAIVRGFLKR